MIACTHSELVGVALSLCILSLFELAQCPKKQSLKCDCTMHSARLDKSLLQQVYCMNYPQVAGREGLALHSRLHRSLGQKRCTHFGFNLFSTLVPYLDAFVLSGFWSSLLLPNKIHS